jgi:hypothetical protein
MSSAVSNGKIVWGNDWTHLLNLYADSDFVRPESHMTNCSN